MTARHSHHLRRHPGTPEAHRVLRRVGAVLQLLAVLALPPALLLGLVGSPLNPPAPLRSTDALTSALDDRSVLWLIALAGWLLYAHLLSSLLVEALRQTRGANLRLPLPGLMFGANAALASHLVASLLLTTPLGAGAGDGTGRLTPAVVQVVAVAPASVGGAAAAPPQANDEPAPSPAVAGMAGERVSNVPAGGVPMSDSGSTAGLLQCRVLPPEGRDHDTLWDIAGRHLGDGTRWRDIYALNQGRLMPDGQRLTRASLIYPGWILTLPADAIALDVDRVPLPEQATTPQAAPPSAAHSTANPPAPARPAHAVPDRTDRTPPVLAAPTSDATGSGAAPTSPALPAAGPSGQPGRSPAPSASAGAPTAEPALVEDLAQESAQESDADYQLPLAGLLTAGSLGLLVALTRRRKVAARRRPPGVRVALPGPDLIEQECQLREEARRADDIAATLRLALHLAVRTTPPAQIQAVWQHPDRSLELCWTDSGAHTPVPAPFQPTERGWLLPADAHRLLWAARQGAGKDGTAPRSGPPELTDDQGRAELVAGLDRRADDPFPLLTPVGTRHGSACLVNLEAFRIVSLTGPPGPAQAPAATHLAEADLPAAPPHAGPEEVVSAWVQALGGAPWASGVRAYVPPRLADLGIGLDRVEVNADRGPLYALTGEQLEQVHDHGSHLAARLADAEFAEDILELYAGYHQAELPAGALQLARDGLHPITVLLLDVHPDAQFWTLNSDGRLSIPGVANDLEPLRLDPDRLDRLRRLLEHAQDPPHAAPDDPQREQMLQQCGPPPEPVELAAGPTPRSHATVHAPSDDVDGHLDDVLADAPGDELGDDLDTAHSGDPTEDRAATTSCTAVAVVGVDSSQRHEADVTSEWQVGPVEVGVLGPTTVSGLSRPVPRPVTLEMLVFMAFHRRPMRGRETWEGMWPFREYQDQTLRARRHELKTFIDPLLLTRAGHHYELDELVSTDWQRFTALADGNPDQQLAALALVRGRPFASCELDWFHLEGQKSEIEASITDLALSVGQRALRQRDYDTASTAALAGLRGAPYEERLYRIAMQSAAARGATAELKELRRRLDIALADELEPDDEMQPATRDLLSDLADAERRPSQLKRGQQ